MKNKNNKLDPTFMWSLIASTLITIIISWCLIAFMYHDIIQGVLYPYSHYPVIVHSPIEIMILPGVIMMWLGVMFGVTQALITLFDHSWLKAIKKKLFLPLGVMLAISIITFAADLVIWPIVAKSKGYSSCPYDTLLFGQKMSTAWSKKETFCYDKGVQSRLSTGTFEQVVQVAKYLDGKHLDKKD